MKISIKKILLIFLFTISVFSVLAKDFYWVGGTGYWTDPQHWSDRPGGEPIGETPRFEDNVFFDDKSFTAPNEVVTINTIAVCSDMDWSKVTNNPQFISDNDDDTDLSIYGCIKLNVNMTFSFVRPIYFRASSDVNIIDMQGQSFEGDIYFQNNGGWNVEGNINVIGKSIYFEQGNLEVNGEVNCSQIISENALSRRLILNNSDIKLEGNDISVWKVNGDNLFLDTGNSTIYVLGNNAVFETIGADTLIYNNINFNGSNATLCSEETQQIFNEVFFERDGNIKGNNVYTDLMLSIGGNYLLAENSEQIISGMFTAKGDCYNYITIKSNEGIANIVANEVEIKNIRAQNLQASGNAAPFIAPESFDFGSCIGWNISNPFPKNFTWVGNQTNNNWSNPNNWDVNCAPTQIDNVDIGNNTVFLDVDAECFNMTLSSGTRIEGSSNLYIFGSLSADDADWSVTGETHFVGSETGIFGISIKNNTFKGDVFFDGIGKWEMQSDLNVSDYSINLLSGELDTKSFSFTAKEFHSSGEKERTLILGSSNVTINGTGEKAWEASGNNFALNAGNSQVRMIAAEAGFYSNLTNPVQYNKISFNSVLDWASLKNEGVAINIAELEFKTNAKIEGNNNINTLKLEAGKTYSFQKGSIQTITGSIEATGTCAETISLKGDGGKATINSDVDITITSVKIENLLAEGSGNHMALDAIDLGGTGGTWDITPPGSRELHWSGKSEDGNWFNPKNWKEECMPTQLDNVYFSQTDFISDNLEVNIPDNQFTAVCKTMNWNNAPTLAKFIGEGELKIYGSLYFVGLNILEYSGNIELKSNASEEIETGGSVLLGNLNIKGNNDGLAWESGSYTLLDLFKTSRKLIIERGELNTNNHNIEADELNASFSSDRVINLGNSQVYLNSLIIAPDNLEFNAGTSMIYFHTNGFLLNASGNNAISYNKIIFNDDDGLAQISTYADNASVEEMIIKSNANLQYGSLSIDKLTLTLGKTYRFQEEKNFNIGALTALGGCDGFINISTFSSGVNATFISKNGDEVLADGVNLMDIHAEGADFTANNSIDLGNNNGWTINPKTGGANLYWVGGTGNWNDKSHWSFTSGGVGGACLPTAFDNVYFDSNSFTQPNQTVYTGSNDIRCKTMDWTGAFGNPQFVSDDGLISGIYIYGSLILINEMTIDLPEDINIYFLSAEKGQIVKTGEYLLTNDVIFDGLSGEWTLNDNFRTEGNITLNNGSIKTNGWELECLVFASENTTTEQMRILNIENSNVILNAYDNEAFKIAAFNDMILAETFELHADNSTILIKNSGKIEIVGLAFSQYKFDKVQFENYGIVNSNLLKLDFKHLIFNKNGEIYGNNLFDILEFTRGNQYRLQEQNEITIRSEIIAEGSCNFPITIQSSKIGSEATIIKASGEINLDYVEMQDIHAKNTGAAYNATNSNDNGNNTGWNISEPIIRTLFWVGNGATDEWDDYENWSPASGGVAEGCIPTIIDDVVFDNNSFLGSKEVNINIEAYCHNMTWQSDIDPAAKFNVKNTAILSGSLNFTDKMSVNVTAELTFVGDGKTNEKTVNLAGKILNGDIIFDGENQNWNLESDFTISGTLFLNNGFIDTQDNNMGISGFESVNFDSDEMRKIELGNSQIKITSSSPKAWNTIFMNSVGETTLEVNSDLSLIEFTKGGGMYCEHINGALKFNDIIFHDNGILNMKNISGEFNTVIFNEKSEIKGDNSFNNLELTVGHHNTIEAGKTIKINENLKMEGVSCESVELKSDISGKEAYISKLSDEVNTYHVRLKDIHVVSGGADFFVNGHFEDEGNNDGWIEKTSDDESPSWGFDDPIKKEFCTSLAVIDDVKDFPVNKNTTYQWYKFNAPDYDEIPDATNQEITITETGEYKVQVIYSPTCYPEAEIEVIIDANPKMQISAGGQDLKCFNDNSGEVSIEVSEGYNPYTYNWIDDNGINVSSESIVNGLPAGKYLVTVIDNQSCEKTAETEIFDAYPLNLQITEKTDIQCYGDNTGKIVIEANGGTGNLYYYMDETELSETTIENLTAAEYKIFVQDDNNCKTTEQTLTINQPDLLVAEIYDFDKIVCYGEGKGRALASVTGGTASYEFIWSDGQKTQEAINLEEGDYKVVVTDANNCADSASIEISEPEPLEIDVEVTNPITTKSEDGEIYLQVTGGMPSYTFTWDDLNSISSELINLNPGNYNVTITDFNGCLKDTLIVLKNQFDDRVVIPKTFTPNNDGYNDIWEIERIHLVKKLKIAIYSRWGNVVYKFNGSGTEYQGNPWNGIEGITTLAADSYYYAIQLDNDKPIVGYVTVVVSKQ